jgi:hypothetical protein
MLGRLAMVAVLAAVVASPGAGAQAPPPSGRLMVFGEPEQVVTLKPPADGRDGREGRLTLIVRNESDLPVRLRIRFVADGGNSPVLLRTVPARPFPADKPTLYTENTNLAAGLMLRRRQTVLVPLRFGVAERATADVINGTLIVAAQANPRVQSAAVRITGQLPQAGLPPAQPPKITLRVERWWPWGLVDGRRRVVEPTVWVPGEKSDALVLLSSGSGHSLKARLAEPDDDPPVPTGAVQQRLMLAGDLGPVGTYAGELTLKPGDSEKITVEAKVRDVILWPLLFVGIGAAIGGFGATFFQRWRTGRILRAELARARRDYENRIGDSPIGPLDGIVSQDALDALQAEISEARSAEELDALTERVRAVGNSVHAWIAIDDAARSLISAQDVPPDARVVQTDTEAALDTTKWIPADKTASAELVTRLRRQERIVRAFDAAYKRWPEMAIARYDKHRAFSDDGEDKAASVDDAKTAILIGALDRVPDQPDYIIVLPIEERRTRMDEFSLGLQAVENERLDAASAFFPKAQRPVAIVQLSPEQIERPIRRWDLALALATFGVTVFTFVLGVYDDDFGTWDDYAKAFTAGLLGQVGGAALWNLFPRLRSYRLPVPKSAT